MSGAIEQSDLREGYKSVKLGPREIPIPGEWEAVPFEEAIELNPKYDKPHNGPFDYLPMDAVDEEKQTIEYWTQRDKGDCTTTWFKEGDTVYAKITPCTENGKIAFIDGLTTEVGSGSTEFLVFHPREGVTDERFVYYLANLPEFRSVTISLMEGSTGRQRVPNDVFNGSLNIPIPSLPEQRRIADILSTVDDQIRQTDEIINEIHLIREGLVQRLMMKGIGVDSYKEVQIGPRTYDIPEKWFVKEVGDLLCKSTDNKAIRGGPPGGRLKKGGRTTEGPKLYVQENIIHKDYELGDEYLSKSSLEVLSGAILEPGDVLITRAGTDGHSDVFPDSAPQGIMDSNLIRLKVDREQIIPEYLSTFISESPVARFQIDSMSHGGTRSNLNNGIVKSLQIPVPSLSNQEYISDIFSLVEDRIAVEKESKARYQELKRGLMQDLLTGKVRVNTS